MISYMAQPRCPLNSQVLAIFFHSAAVQATLHYPEFTDRYFSQYGRLSFSLHFMIHTASLLYFPHFHIISQSQDCPKPMYATIPDPGDGFAVSLPPSSLSHSHDLGCVRA